MYIPTTEALEQLIDSNGLGSVLETIADICYAKAEHLEHNWQDHATSVMWAKAGTAVTKARRAVISFKV